MHEDVVSVDVDLEKGKAEIEADNSIAVEDLQNLLPPKYSISEEEHRSTKLFETQNSKWEQLKPLFLILFYIGVASVLLNISNWDWETFMLDFMGLFLVVFSFFKMLDLKGFPESFRMYDPLAAKIPFYGKIYPFLETALGLMFLMRFEIKIALIITLIVLGITTIGVTKTLVDKRKIKCACLGTVLNLPMTEATLIENSIMLIMGLMLLF